MKSDQISVVVQGAAGPDLKTCLASVRRRLPQAQIILSTWQGSDLAPDLPVDDCVLSPDPGARVVHRKGKLLNNTNRQLVSTMAGLRLATRPFTLKMRTDFELDHCGFIKAFDTDLQRQPEFIHYKRRIVVPHYATRFPDSRISYPFHPSDISLFGLTEDLLKHFDAPLIDDSGWNWAERHLDDIEQPDDGDLYLPQFAPEQHFFIHSLRRHGHDVPVTHYHDHRDGIPELSRRFLVNNFVVQDMPEFGVRTGKPALAYAIVKDGADCYSTALYRAEYRRWCDPAAPLNWRESLEARLSRRKRMHEKLLKHQFAVRQHAASIFSSASEGRFTHCHKMLADAISSIYYFVRAIV